VSIAMPFERPAISEALLRIVLDAFPPRDRGQRPLEIVVNRRQDTPAARVAGTPSVRQGSPSWT
jgi:hypothetical protein